MSKMQQQPPHAMNSDPSSAPLNVVSSEQIQKLLDENRNLIIAIMENQKLGKIAECVQYQAILQKNLMYLAAIADAQPQGSMPPASSISPQRNSHQLQTQPRTMQLPPPGVPVTKLSFQLNQEPQKNQEFQFQLP